MEFYEISISQVRIFRFYSVNNKYDDDKIYNQIGEKSQVLTQVLE